VYPQIRPLITAIPNEPEFEYRWYNLNEHIYSEPVARNALARFAIRRFINNVRVGKITMQELSALFEIPDKPKSKLRF
jgi:hypothetical protein